MRLFRNASLVIAAILLVPIVVAGQAPPQVQAPQEDAFLKGAYPADTPGLKMPVVKRTVHPRYTSAAMREKVQGQVEVEVVVLADGTVDRARVVKSLDKVNGLDEQAPAAAKQWTFEPATLNGEKVAVAVKFDLQFRLH